MLKNIDLYLLIGGGLIVSRLVDGAFCILSLDVFVSSCSLPEDICADGSVSITTYKCQHNRRKQWILLLRKLLMTNI